MGQSHFRAIGSVEYRDFSYTYALYAFLHYFVGSVEYRDFSYKWIINTFLHHVIGYRDPIYMHYNAFLHHVILHVYICS